MIKIRYRDPNELSPGLHAEAERHGRCTTVYLLSGLTKRERRAALRRLRLSARMGYCPSLPAPQLAVALLKDRIRTGAGQTGAVFRLHPAGSTVPIMVLSGGAIAFLLLSTVSIRVLHPHPGGLAAGTPPITAASAIPNPAGSSQGQEGSGLGNQGVVSSPAADIGPGYGGSAVNQAGSAGPGANGNPGSVNPGSTGTGSSGIGTGSTGTWTGSGQNGTGSNGTGSNGTGSNSTGSNSTGSGQNGTSSGTGSSGNGGSSESSGSTKSSGGSSTSGSGSGSSGGAAASATTPASTATTPAATSSSSGGSSGSGGGGVCLDVGPLGVCLNV
jgi:hypothetical protein